MSHGPSFFIGLRSAFALFVIKRKEKVFGHFIQFRGRTFLIASFFKPYFQYGAIVASFRSHLVDQPGYASAYCLE